MESTDTSNSVYLSVVAAAFNEKDNLPQLLKEIHQALSNLGRQWEVVITNDGSTDGTDQILHELMGNYPQLRVLNQKRRSGQTAGWDAGIRNARGELVVTMDADLQNDPADIPKLLDVLKEQDVDMVNGWRKDRKDPWMRLVSTRIANGVRNWLTGESIHDSACGLKLFKAECLRDIKMFNGMHRFMPTLVRMHGFRVAEVPVNHRPRIAGKAKYGVWNRVFRALRDTFAIRWMRSRLVLYEVEEWER